MKCLKIKKVDCCGCWACVNACPVSCIKMSLDDEGFLYPQVDTSKCINCGRCDKVCPIKKEKIDTSCVLASYAAQNLDKDELRKSTSGGFFSVLMKFVISQSGVVFGAAFDENMELKHTYFETYSECKSFRGSKYVQSLIGNSYSLAKSFLDDGRLVLFSGTPCQIAGLKSFLSKTYENLITVDLVCHGVPSPLLFKNFFLYQESINKSRVVGFLSRDKYYGYLFSTATIKFENPAIKYHKGIESDPLLKLYFKNICSRPSCYNCHFKTISRVSDFTIFDCWNASSLNDKFGDAGATNIFIHTEKGKDVFDIIKSNFLYESTDLERVVKEDGIMITRSVPQNPLRSLFFADLRSKPFPYIINEYVGCSFFSAYLAMIKPFFYKIGLFKIYLKMKKIIK
ncbi:MAG: Coenzyme F420 hydrogenase/dehydrogenase, beta subunit C-terminal domain [Saprospiraceae bacterium]|jgi:coenzyme F420-reducing hydrogenase beta subunit|nr:Coenzyme F420 hydrogenase/dehydrogenase, beta subunit C-terminal domain [Saprospiraceae bacterium]